jgi:pimeloyl-ACP methyl ester carboxylesterase
MEDNSRTVKTQDGRAIRFLEAGDPQGIPMLVLHGTPGSRIAPRLWVEAAHPSGMRLISYDRPGYGGSTPQPGREVASAAGDVAAIARELGLERITVWGASGGGPHALACAALLPELVAGVASLASPAPYQADGLDWMAGMGQANLVEFGAALEGWAALEAFIEAEAAGLLGAAPEELHKAFDQSFRSLISPVDAEALSGDFLADLIQGILAGMRPSRQGWIEDDLAFVRPWGFDLEQIRVPVLLKHGEQDRFVPIAHGEWLAAHIPGVEAQLLPEEGHISLVVQRVAEVYEWLKGKMG